MFPQGHFGETSSASCLLQSTSKNKSAYFCFVHRHDASKSGFWYKKLQLLSGKNGKGCVCVFFGVFFFMNDKIWNFEKRSVFFSRNALLSFMIFRKEYGGTVTVFHTLIRPNIPCDISHLFLLTFTKSYPQCITSDLLSTVIWYKPIKPRILHCLLQKVDDRVKPAPERERHGVCFTSIPTTAMLRQDHIVLKHPKLSELCSPCRA